MNAIFSVVTSWAAMMRSPSFSVLGVENDDELSRAEGLDRGLDRVEALGQGEGAGRLHTEVLGWTAVFLRLTE